MKTVVTHSGAFHADEIFAVATLKLALEEDFIVKRTRDKDAFETADFVIDVGLIYDPHKGRFDHHQAGGAGVRDTSIPYASFGLLWKEYGLALCSGDEAVAGKIERKLVMPIDATDNGVSISTNLHKDIYPYTINDLFGSYFPDTDVTNENIDKAFLACVAIAKDVLFREISRAKNYVTQEQLVEDIYQKTEEKGIIVLDQRLPWAEVLSRHPEPLFVVYPDIDGVKYSVKCVRVNARSFESRKLFPESWAGKTDSELAAITGVPDALFCHNARFIAVAGSREGAIQLAEIAKHS